MDTVGEKVGRNVNLKKQFDPLDSFITNLTVFISVNEIRSMEAT